MPSEIQSTISMEVGHLLLKDNNEFMKNSVSYIKTTNIIQNNNILFNINDFDPYNYMPVQNLNVNYTRNAEYESRLAGEGATPTTFQIHPFEPL